MKEEFLHYIWQYKLFKNNDLQTTDGQAVEVVNVGMHNTDGGPDFFNAKIKIDNTLWVGNVEIHTAASDWHKHAHQRDKAYDSVILHVVKIADAGVTRTTGESIPQMELPYPAEIEENYLQLLAGRKQIACQDKISQVPAILVSAWKNTLLSERLMAKTAQIEQLLQNNIQHWEEAFYVILARSFGFGLNSQAFEMLAKSLPLNILAKHKDNLLQIEALLFGQSGLLLAAGNDRYVGELNREYAFLRAKYNLQPLPEAVWKMLRLRPDNFPHVRIAEFAALIHRSQKLFSKIVECPERNSICKLFDVEASEFWETHYTFSETAAKRSKHSKHLGQKSIHSIIINTIVPFVFLYGDKKASQEMKDSALKLLEELPAEKNAIIDFWKSLGISADSAYDSQALLQLKKNYCSQLKCLHCRIGHKVMTRTQP